MNKKTTTEDITAVVCSWNCAETIEACLRSLQENKVGEVILVDADSDDGTRETAASFVDMILSDPREGLAKARNTGIAQATKKYVINVGADNVMPTGSIQKMVDSLEDCGYSGISAMTELLDAKKSYFSRAMDAYKKARYYPSERAVIGTPTLFLSELLQREPYDNKMSWSDDGDLCARLGAAGHRFAIADVTVYEIGSENLGSIIYRWKGYGRSDLETYSKYSSSWGFFRRLSSLLYPLRSELIKPFFRIPGIQRICFLPFLLLITSIRYTSWMRLAIMQMKRK